MAAETLDISLRADISELKSALSGLEGIGKKEAGAMVRGMVKEYKKAEKAATKLGRTTGVEVSKGFDKASGAAERSASLMGGAMGDVSDSIIDLGSRFGELAGEIGGVKGAVVGLGGGMIAVSAGIGFAAHATMEWLDTADDVRRTLEGVSGLPPLAAHHESSLSTYGEAARDADAAIALLSLTMMGQLAPAFTEVQHTIVGVASVFTNVLGGMTDFRENTAGVTQVLDGLDIMLQAANVPLTAMGWALGEAAERGEELAESIEHVSDATLEWEGLVKQTDDEIASMAALLGYDLTPAVVDLDKRSKDAAKSTRDLAKAAEEEWVAANAQQAKINELVQTFDDLVAAEEAATRAANENAQAFDDNVAAVGEAFDGIEAQVSDTTASVQMTMAGFYAEMGMASAAAITDTIGQFADAELGSLQRQVEERRKLFQAGKSERDAERDKIAAQLEGGEISKEQAEARLATLQAEGESARGENFKTRKAEEAAVLKAFKAKKATQIADATMQAAQNTLALIPAFAYLGLGAPAAAAAVSVAALGAQLKAINSAKAPEFPMGGMPSRGSSPDHFQIGVQAGEGVLSRSGVGAVGGPEGVDQLNRGTASLGAGPVIVQLDGRTIGAAVLSAGRTGAVARDADRRAGTLPGIKGVR